MFDPVEMHLVSWHRIQLVILRNITMHSRFKQAQRTDDGRIKPKLLVVFEECPVCMLWMSGSRITVRQPRQQSHLLRGIQDDTCPIDIIVAHNSRSTASQLDTRCHESDNRAGQYRHHSSLCSLALDARSKMPHAPGGSAVACDSCPKSPPRTPSHLPSSSCNTAEHGTLSAVWQQC